MAMKTPQIPAERWIANLLEAAQLISNREYQESNRPHFRPRRQLQLQVQLALNLDNASRPRNRPRSWPLAPPPQFLGDTLLKRIGLLRPVRFKCDQAR